MPAKKESADKVGRPISVLKQVTHGEGFEERRKTARLDIPVKVQYKVIGKGKKEKNAVTKDVSAGGCLLLVSEELSIDSELEFQILLGEDESARLDIKGKIVRLNRSERGLYEYGIAFDTLSREARRLFADFCFKKMYEMIGLSEWPTDRKIKKEDLDD